LRTYLPQRICVLEVVAYILAQGHFWQKLFYIIKSNVRGSERMNNDFENSKEFKKALEIVKKQEELYKSIIKTYTAISPEALAKLQELNDKISKWKNSINNMPGLLKMAEILKNYEQEVRENEGLTESEYEEKYRDEIEWSEKFGRNGWVITQHSNLADIKKWEQSLCEGEARIAGFFDGNGIAILDVVTEELKEKYVTGVSQRYFNKGIKAFVKEDYMTTAIYLFALLDFRVNQLVDFPDKYMPNREKYSNEGFVIKRRKILKNSLKDEV